MGVKSFRSRQLGFCSFNSERQPPLGRFKSRGIVRVYQLGSRLVRDRSYSFLRRCSLFSGRNQDCAGLRGGVRTTSWTHYPFVHSRRNCFHIMDCSSRRNQPLCQLDLSRIIIQWCESHCSRGWRPNLHFIRLWRDLGRSRDHSKLDFRSYVGRWHKADGCRCRKPDLHVK